MKPGLGLLGIVAAMAGLAAVPFVAPPFYANLLVPFFGYAIALLGFNLLFGYAGLLSFGHAMFLALGAYGAAVVAGVLGIKHFEAVLVAVTLAAIVVALPIGAMCVRYTGIFFGMLTLALLSFRQTLPHPWVIRQAWAMHLHNPRTGVPYGIAIATAGLVVYPDISWAIHFRL